MYSDEVNIICSAYSSPEVPFDKNTDAVVPSCLDDITIMCNPYFLEFSAIEEHITYIENINPITLQITSVDLNNTYRHIPNEYDYNCFNDISMQLCFKFYSTL